MKPRKIIGQLVSWSRTEQGNTQAWIIMWDMLLGWTINCHWARSSHSCKGWWCHWNIRKYLSNDEALHPWPVSMQSAQYTPVSRHTRYSILACCTGFTSFSEPSSSSSPGHTKKCIRFLVCADKVYCSTCASTEPMQPTPFSYPHSLYPYLAHSQQPTWHGCVCWKIIWKFCLGFHVCILVLHTCYHVSVLALHTCCHVRAWQWGENKFFLAGLVWVTNSINRLQLVGWFLHVANETGYIANISK